MTYLLDANIIIALLRGADVRLRARLQEIPPAEVVVSTIVLHELYYGAFRSGRPAHHLGLLDAQHFHTLDFNGEDARQAGEIRALLANRGVMIGPFDTLIAGQALARNLILVTRNAREFARVPNLRMEDWQI